MVAEGRTLGGNTIHGARMAVSPAWAGGRYSKPINWLSGPRMFHSMPANASYENRSARKSNHLPVRATRARLHCGIARLPKRAAKSTVPSIQS